MAAYRCRLTFIFDDGRTYSKDEVVEANNEADAKSKAEQRHLIRDRTESSMEPVATLVYCFSAVVVTAGEPVPPWVLQTVS